MNIRCIICINFRCCDRCDPWRPDRGGCDISFLLLLLLLLLSLRLGSRLQLFLMLLLLFLLLLLLIFLIGDFFGGYRYIKGIHGSFPNIREIKQLFRWKGWWSVVVVAVVATNQRRTTTATIFSRSNDDDGPATSTPMDTAAAASATTATASTSSRIVWVIAMLLLTLTPGFPSRRNLDILFRDLRTKSPLARPFPFATAGSRIVRC